MYYSEFFSRQMYFNETNGERQVVRRHVLTLLQIAGEAAASRLDKPGAPEQSMGKGVFSGTKQAFIAEMYT
ncbi:hypothetical protein SARC_00471 [Sphaeroforma arctica JP610]|uniref:Uncharacterized protein n=1 Tax=Sphaeroforma arctica JP610 TaxID=667725 RepID=A0A0L0GEX8_9EUKA|nr:hypothetical protein SARC_00471 [Sphaeroforma arctica JP610]KNC87434.1 hypothetical protein SARC_00471 [Sphaeroforma arctica JP610]|eukprot:XP_014161336.1 hypothetical protein SARC_00471 [Sphaeroforma arctica JP610]